MDKYTSLPWEGRIDNPIFSEYPVPLPEYVIYGKSGKHLVASVWSKSKLGDKEGKANYDLIITAVNVMPEMKVFLRGAQAGGLMTRRTIERRASELLEKLEGVNVH